MQLTGFEGRHAFVTGAAGGVGQAIVDTLGGAGALVTATDTAQSLAALAPQDGARTRWQELDVTVEKDIVNCIADAENHFGPVQLGAHAAGVLNTESLMDMSSQNWRTLFSVNAEGAFLVGRTLGRVITQNGGGAIVMIGSNAAGIPRMNMGAYAASKAAMTMMARCLGLELASRNVRCNVVAPGSTLTPMLQGMWADENGADMVIAGNPQQFRTGIPLGKLAQPEDIAQAAIYLLSDQAGHVTMADLYVDGGATLRA
ncbi:SDR family oxidoreductase [Ruegeria sp. Ofav3-42]|uniref:SDR family oxidoreductase n=1 Tax=Ruegeria sp. Ofav3-42 TaxID=2917759 RepID=UPI001EF5BA11|nr:SDR family oxidoreductase [Ruegeria sp. Ofav3-42]MCG7521799.1 SDR family oxidoreductase [Ruegeria sp. Ofav3-42]